MCHNSITLSLMTCPKQCLALVMMSCLMIFETTSLTLIEIFISMMMSLMTLLFYHQTLLCNVWLMNLITVFVIMNLKNTVALLKIENKSNGSETPNEPPDPLPN